MMKHTQFQIFKITLKVLSQKHETTATNLPIQIRVNGINNRIAFKIKTGYILEHSIYEAMKLLKIIEKNNDKERNIEKVWNLDIT